MTNIEVIREMYRCAREGDFDTFRGLCNPGVVWTQNAGFPNRGVRVGADAIIEGVFERFLHEWTSWKCEIIQILKFGDLFVVLGAYDGIFARTGRHMRSDAAHVFWLHDGTIVAYKQFAETKMVHNAMRGKQMKRPN